MGTTLARRAASRNRPGRGPAVSWCAPGMRAPCRAGHVRAVTLRRPCCGTRDASALWQAPARRRRPGRVPTRQGGRPSPTPCRTRCEFVGCPGGTRRYGWEVDAGSPVFGRTSSAYERTTARVDIRLPSSPPSRRRVLSPVDRSPRDDSSIPSASSFPSVRRGAFAPPGLPIVHLSAGTAKSPDLGFFRPAAGGRDPGWRGPLRGASRRALRRAAGRHGGTPPSMPLRGFVIQLPVIIRN